MLLGIVIVSHGSFADGILSSLDMIFGNHEDCFSVCLTEGVDSFKNKLIKRLDFLSDNYDNVLAFADLKGGTPFNQLLSYKLENSKDQMKIVAGVNLPVLIEAMSQKNSQDIEQLTKYIIESGKNAITEELLVPETNALDSDDDILG